MRERTTPLISTFIASLEMQRDTSFSNHEAANMTIGAHLEGEAHTYIYIHTCTQAHTDTHSYTHRITLRSTLV